MSSVDSVFLSDDLSGIETGVASEAGLSSSELEEYRQTWEQVIDRRLIEWGREPSILADDDIKVPSCTTIQRAIELARLLASRGCPPPVRVVPDGDGGISFEWTGWAEPWMLEVDSEGHCELLAFRGSRLISRSSVPISSY